MSDAQYPGGFLPAEHPGVTPPDWYTPYPTPAAEVPASTPALTAPAAAPSAAAPGPTSAQRAIFDQIRSVLNGAGLADLYGTDAAGNPSGWLWEQIVADKGAAAILLDMEQTQPFQARFGIITKLREAAGSNPSVHVPTPAEVMAYRTTVASTLRGAGLPSWFYDEQSDFDDLMTKGLSAAEVEDRLGEAWTRVAEADPAIRSAFQQFYGVADGEAGMVAFFLDPARTTQKLNVATRAAYTAGRGSTLGITVSKDVAEAVARLPLSESGIEAGLGQVSGMSGLLTESLSEGGEDLDTDTAISATLLGDGGAAQRLARRQTERQALNRSTGGALTTGAGVRGVGT